MQKKMVSNKFIDPRDLKLLKIVDTTEELMKIIKTIKKKVNIKKI
jgi:predicted Rossmann-fold nucleotide-binding protein